MTEIRQPFDKLLFLDIHNNYILNTLQKKIDDIDIELKNYTFYYSLNRDGDFFSYKDAIEEYSKYVKCVHNRYIISFFIKNAPEEIFLKYNNLFTPILMLTGCSIEDKDKIHRLFRDILNSIILKENKIITKLINKRLITEHRLNKKKLEMGIPI